MIVIKEPDKKKKKLYYIYDCGCGCEFAVKDSEFYRERRPDGKVWIYCPNCGGTVDRTNMTNLSEEEYLELENKYKEE